MATIFKERDFGRAMPFAVETPDGSVVGLTRYMRMNEASKRLEIGGTFYAKSVQRTGVNTEAKLLLVGIPVLIWTLLPIYHIFLFSISSKSEASWPPPSLSRSRRS